jgi:fimbrial chaperone protein
MRSRTMKAGSSALVGLLLLGSAQLEAATFSINPLRVELDARHRTDIITLKNVADAPLRVQVREMLWTMADDGQWQLTPSKDLIVTPELVEIAPGASAQFRVGPLIDPAASEGTYRLLLDELPNLEQGESKPEIRVLTQISMPVFVEPTRRTRVPALGPASIVHGSLSLALRAGGTQRLDPQNLKVTVQDGSGHVLEQRDATASYVLPGRTWFMNLKLAADTCAHAATVSVTWPDLASASLSQAITRDANACAGSDSH